MQTSLNPFGADADDRDQATVTSRIAGAFEGWSGRTVFRLSNGQLWQQDSPGYLYRYAYMPKAAILPAATGYRLMVEGTQQTIRVRRLR